MARMVTPAGGCDTAARGRLIRCDARHAALGVRQVADARGGRAIGVRGALPARVAELADAVGVVGMVATELRPELLPQEVVAASRHGPGQGDAKWHQEAKHLHRIPPLPLTNALCPHLKAPRPADDSAAWRHARARS